MRAGMRSSGRATSTKCNLPWEPWTGAGLSACTIPVPASSSLILQDASKGPCPSPLTMPVEACHCMRHGGLWMAMHRMTCLLWGMPAHAEALRTMVPCCSP